VLVVATAKTRLYPDLISSDLLFLPPFKSITMDTGYRGDNHTPTQTSTLPSPPANTRMPANESDKSSTHSSSASSSFDIFSLSAVDALRMLCTSVETLVRITGDVPPTPPISYPNTPNTHSVVSAEASTPDNSQLGCSVGACPRMPSSSGSVGGLDGVPQRRSSNAESGYSVMGAHMEPAVVQHEAIMRKFYSKHPPSITLEEYLLRLHRYCPMSTAVYLATSLYIQRVAVVEKAIPVVRRTTHRLLLAGLRVAMKALEDWSYPHTRFAKVGGVSEVELSRLEISFCFLTNFDLKVDNEVLTRQAQRLLDEETMNVTANFEPRLPTRRRSLSRTNTQG